MRREKEIAKSFNKPNEAIKYFEQLLKSSRSSNDTSRLGYTNTEEGESSNTIEERNEKHKNSKPTCHFCGKKGHTTNVSMTSLKTWVTITSAIKKVIRHMNVSKEPQKHQDLKVTTTIIKSMDIEPSSADLSPCGHQTNQ